MRCIYLGKWNLTLYYDLLQLELFLFVLFVVINVLLAEKKFAPPSQVNVRKCFQQLANQLSVELP